MPDAAIECSTSPPRKTSEYDFPLPSEFMGVGPVGRRGDARLMVMHREGGRIEHRAFCDIVRYLKGRQVYVNNSHLLPNWIPLWRMPGYREKAFLIRKVGERRWLAFMGTVPEAERFQFFSLEGRKVQVASAQQEHRWILEFEVEPDLSKVGRYVLPPTLEFQNELSQSSLCQGLYARIPGSFAASTAGIHFTNELLLELGVRELTLHTAPGAFYKVSQEDPGSHVLEPEYYEIPVPPKGRAVAIGTTVAKALEVWGRTGAPKGWSDLFIYPPFEFKVVEALLTNLHRPRETLLMLTCAFGGFELVMEAHREAIRRGYRFSYYGDLLLIL